MEFPSALLNLQATNNLLKKVPAIPAVKWYKMIPVVLRCPSHRAVRAEADFAHQNRSRGPVSPLGYFHMMKSGEGVNGELSSYERFALCYRTWSSAF